MVLSLNNINWLIVLSFNYQLNIMILSLNNIMDSFLLRKICGRRMDGRTWTDENSAGGARVYKGSPRKVQDQNCQVSDAKQLHDAIYKVFFFN